MKPNDELCRGAEWWMATHGAVPMAHDVYCILHCLCEVQIDGRRHNIFIFRIDVYSAELF